MEGFHIVELAGEETTVVKKKSKKFNSCPNWVEFLV